MIEATTQIDLSSLLIENLKGGSEMKGSVYHLRGICSLCREGDKNQITHKYHYISVYLPYLQKKKHNISGREKGKPFADGIDAYIYLREIQSLIEDKTFIPWSYRGKAGSITLFETFFDKYKSRYNEYRKHFLPLFTLDLTSIDRITVKHFYRNLSPTLKTSSKNLLLKILRSTLSEAYQEGFINTIPAFPKKDTPEKPVKNWLTWEEQKMVIVCLPNNYRLLFLFLACHGKRISEALSLRWEDIDFKDKSFKIYESKVKTESRLPMHDEFYNSLPFAGAINKTGLVFEYHRNVVLNRILKDACRKAGVKKVTTHEFGRHSFVSQRIASGFTNEQIALVTNNLASIKVYSHLSTEQKRKIINQRRDK